MGQYSEGSGNREAVKIVVAVRCYNEEKNITRFLRGYDFCDHIVISDGGSTDYSVDIIKYHQKYNPKIHLVNFNQKETMNGQTWNPDAPHMNFVLDAAKKFEPTWLIFDDMDCVPTRALRMWARDCLEDCPLPQVNAFRLYLWGDTRYFPFMNRDFDEAYTSLWAWRPDTVDIRPNPDLRHGTLTGLAEELLTMRLKAPYCLLHKSWSRETIKEKMKRYNALGLPMEHPFTFAGRPKRLPEWAAE